MITKDIAKHKDISAFCFHQPWGMLSYIQSSHNQMFGYKIVCISDDVGDDDGGADDDHSQALS